MIDKLNIEEIVNEFINGGDIFLVAVRLSSTGKITVLIDKKSGITIEECAGLSRFIEKRLDRDVKDYELQVSSPGLDMPFIVREQYYKNEGRKIEVIDTGGKKYTGILKNVNEGGFEITIEVRSKSQGKKKNFEITDISFNYEQVKSAREFVAFK